MLNLTPNPLRSCGFALAFALAAAVPAGATSHADIVYDGPGGFGLSQATALAAAAAGIRIVPLNDIDFAEGLNAIQNLDRGTTQFGPPATITSNWNVRNEDWLARNSVDPALVDDLLLIFARPILNSERAQSILYDPLDVGLTLRNGAGTPDWVIVQFPVGPDLYYYPAVSLGSLGDGQTTSSPFAVEYILDNPQTYLDPSGFELGIPRWQLWASFVPIPEPTTALMLGLGLSALAAGRRRRS